jgi:ATP-dependent RNA helicase DDX27
VEGTHRLTRLLQLFGIRAAEYSSSVPMRDRAAALTALQSGSVRALVASDAMARGMDIDSISVVINYDPPANMKGYVHRVGRTARAGREGTSYTLLREAEVHHFKVSMAKAGKPWRSLDWPNKAAALAELSMEYDQVLRDLQHVLQEERHGMLPLAASQEAVYEVLRARVLDEESKERATKVCKGDRPSVQEQAATDSIAELSGKSTKVWPTRVKDQGKQEIMRPSSTYDDVANESLQGICFASMHAQLAAGEPGASTTAPWKTELPMVRKLLRAGRPD